MSDVVLKEGEYVVPFGGHVKNPTAPDGFVDKETATLNAKSLLLEVIAFMRTKAAEVVHFDGQEVAQGIKSDLETFAHHLEKVTLGRA